LVGELREEQVTWLEPGYVGYGYDTGVLVGVDGQPITNLYATDAHGNPIEEFRLYDQTGIPVTNVAEFDDTRRYGSNGDTYRSQPPTDDHGLPVRNGYPRDAWLERWDGTTSPVVPPMLPADGLAPTPTAPPTTATTAPPRTEPTAPPVTTVP
jgi:hypothetical protein